MQKKKLGLLITSIVSIGAVSATILASNNISPSLNAEADVEPYTLTINASNKSNFVQDGDVYRGTFKTGLGNDIVFRMKSAPSSKEGVAFEMTSKSDYLINETPLRGVTSMEITGHYLSGTSLSSGYRLYVYYLADLNMVSLDKDELTNSTNYITSVSESDHTYTVNTGSGSSRAGMLYYYIGNKDYFYADRTWVIDSVKYYFSCESTNTYVSVTSSDKNKGTVSIDSLIATDSRYKVVGNNTSVTIHAYKEADDYVNDKFIVFKGWHLNGSEDYISTNSDYTFTTVKDGVYKFVAEFVEAETELFSHGEHIADGYEHTFVYSQKAKKYYPIIGAADSGGTYTHTPQPETRNDNELFIERHEWINYRPSYLSYFKLNVFSPTSGGYIEGYDYKFVPDDQIEKFDPTKVHAVIFYLAMDESGRIDELSSTNGTFTTYRNLQDPLDGGKAMSIVVWTGFTSEEAMMYVPEQYRSGNQTGTLWIKRMKVVYC